MAQTLLLRLHFKKIVMKRVEKYLDFILIVQCFMFAQNESSLNKCFWFWVEVYMSIRSPYSQLINRLQIKLGVSHRNNYKLNLSRFEFVHTAILIWSDCFSISIYRSSVTKRIQRLYIYSALSIDIAAKFNAQYIIQ